ncbi:ATP-binding cassette domain-containing protein [Candidatus Woesearchaeota archaeon]|nr:ATP-binding cassette domain-containing protein [Candidatus Woesearchaeota archaeon]
MSDFAIVSDAVTKRYNGFEALKGVSLRIPRGVVFGLLGPNGAGKTTLLSIFTTLKRANSGSVIVEGFDVQKEKYSVRKLQGVVFQDSSHDGELTAFENLFFHAKLYGMPSDKSRKKILDVLELVGLSDRKDDFVNTFSGGMRRRMEIARALVHEPKILYLDEPTTGLDPQTRNHLWEYLKNLRGTTTIVLTTHYMDEAEKLCDIIAVIDHGSIIAQGNSDDLKRIVGGEVILVRSSDNIIPVLKRSKFKCSVDKHNGIFEIRVDNAEKSIAKILRVLERAGVKISGVDVHRTTLEDVFLHLTGKSLREESPVDFETKSYTNLGRVN